MKNTIALLAVLVLMTSCVSCNYKIKRTHSDTTTTTSVSVGNSNNQSTISHVALHDKDIEVRKAAVSKMTFGPSLTEIAKKDKSAEVRMLAIKRIAELK